MTDFQAKLHPVHWRPGTRELVEDVLLGSSSAVVLGGGTYEGGTSGMAFPQTTWLPATVGLVATDAINVSLDTLTPFNLTYTGTRPALVQVKFSGGFNVDTLGGNSGIVQARLYTKTGSNPADILVETAFVITEDTTPSTVTNFGIDHICTLQPGDKIGVEFYNLTCGANPAMAWNRKHFSISGYVE